MPPLESYRVHAFSRRFQERVEESLRLLTELPKLAACLVSTSWGKDSVVLTDLVLRAWGGGEFLHISRPYALPGDEEPQRAVLGARDASLHEIGGRSIADALAWVREIGLPHERSEREQVAAVVEAKKQPALQWAVDRGYCVMVLGLRAEENQRARGALLRARGVTFERRALGIWSSNPLAFWSARDVWAYIASRSVAYNRRVHDAETHGLTRETIRNTGWLSTDGSTTRGRAAWLRHHFPDEYQRLYREFPEMSSYA